MEATSTDAKVLPPFSGEGSRRGRVRRAATSVWFWRVMVLIFIIAGWELASGTIVRELFISSPSKILERLVLLFETGEIWPHIRATYYEFGVGYLLAAGVGIALGTLFGRIGFLAAVMEPFILAAYSVPRIALAPLFIIWLGIGTASKVGVAFVSAFFLVFYNVFAGMRNQDEELIDLSRLMGASRLDVNRRVVFPAAMPFVMLGLKTGIPFALIGAVVGEFMAASRGLGYYVLYSGSTLDSAGLFAGVLLLVVGVAVMGELIRRLETHLVRWKPQGENGGILGGPRAF